MLAASDFWDPTRAATAGAAFAGVFTAIVLVIAAEIALRSSDRPELRKQDIYVLVPTVLAIVLLAVATYLYVLLAGEPARSEMPVLITLLTEHPVPGIEIPSTTQLLQNSARLFAIAGSTLAMGIMLSGFVVVFLVLRITRSIAIGRLVMLGLLVGFALDAAFVLWGYHDAGVTYQGAGVLRDGIWWPLHAGLFALPFVCMWLVRITLGHFVESVSAATRSGYLARLAIGTWMMAPVLCYLLLSSAATDAVSINVVTLGGTVWCGLALGVVGSWVVAEVCPTAIEHEKRDVERRDPERQTHREHVERVDEKQRDIDSAPVTQPDKQRQTTLADVLLQLDELAAGATIFAVGGTQAELSAAAVVVASLDAEVTSLSIEGMEYVLAVGSAVEAIAVWRLWRDGREPTLEDKHEAVMYYAANDAYLPA